MQKAVAPSVLRNIPEIFCCTLIIRRSLSAWLFVKSTESSSKKYRLCHLLLEASELFSLFSCLFFCHAFSLPAFSNPSLRDLSSYSSSHNDDWLGSLQRENAFSQVIPNCSNCRFEQFGMTCVCFVVDYLNQRSFDI